MPLPGGISALRCERGPHDPDADHLFARLFYRDRMDEDMTLERLGFSESEATLFAEIRMAMQGCVFIGGRAGDGKSTLASLLGVMPPKSIEEYAQRKTTLGLNAISVDLAKKSLLKHIGTFIMFIEHQEVIFETEGLSSPLVAIESTCPGVPPVAVLEAIFRRPRFHQKLRHIVVFARNLLRCHCIVTHPPNSPCQVERLSCAR